MPSVEQIADYLGLSEACCLVCWAKPVERAHALPRSLTGSYSLANLALLCKAHHREAPDVADAEAFWKWIDYAALRDSDKRMALIAEALDLPTPKHELQPEKTAFFTMVMSELQALYDWQEGDFNGPGWSAILTEHYEVLHHNTGRHFGIEAKVSTHAWAMDIARRRVARNSRVSDQEHVNGALALIAACHRDETLTRELADYCLDRLVPVIADPKDASRVEFVVGELLERRDLALRMLEVTISALKPVEPTVDTGA